MDNLPIEQHEISGGMQSHNAAFYLYCNSLIMNSSNEMQQRWTPNMSMTWSLCRGKHSLGTGTPSVLRFAGCDGRWRDMERLTEMV